jgi:hypothetical protein
MVEVVVLDIELSDVHVGRGSHGGCITHPSMCSRNHRRHKKIVRCV